MAELDDDDDLQQPAAKVNGGSEAVTDADIRAMLDQERENSRQLKAQLDTERTGRTKAEATATSHATARLDAEEQIVEGRISTADTEAKGLRKAYADALAEGKFDEAAEVNDKLTELRAKQQQDRQYKTWLEGEKERAKAAPPPQQQQGVDLSQYSAKQRAWIRKNPEFMEDEKMRAKTFAGHQLAIADGIEVDSPEYFEVIDEVVQRGRRAKPSPEDEEPRAVVIRPRREPPAEIPVSRAPAQRDNIRDSTKAISTDRILAQLPAGQREGADITMPDIPVDDSYNAQGVLVKGRYRRYSENLAKLKARGMM
jgi:hypothetical protein